jgi:hypothetical protein
MTDSKQTQTGRKGSQSGKDRPDWFERAYHEAWGKKSNELATLMKIQRDRIRPCLICRKNFTEDGTAIFMRPMENGEQIHVNLGLICDNCREAAIEFVRSRTKR